MIHARQSHGHLESKAQEYLEGWQRARAEFANFRTRLLAQQQHLSRQAQRQAIEPLLAVADNFRAVTAHVPEELADNSWVQGVLHVSRQLEQLLTDLGVQPVTATGQPFDPTQHEAVEEVTDSSVPSGTVLSVVQAGYRLGDELIRPARVTVSR